MKPELLMRAALMASIPAAALWAGQVQAQSQVLPCYRPAGGAGCQAVSVASPLPVVSSGTPSGTQDVNLKQVGGINTDIGLGVAGTGTQRVSTSSDSTLGLVAGTATIGAVILGNTGGGSTIGSVNLLTGTNTVGNVGLVPVATGGLTISSAVLVAGVNSTLLKAAAGQVYHIATGNNSAAIAYLKFYNASSAPATCGAATVVAEYIIPASTSGAGSNIDVPQGLAFSTGIAYCVTAAIGVTDNTTVAAASFIVAVGYK